ncbi:MAG: SH3 domain-containing protein [Polyangiales bacterium]
MNFCLERGLALCLALGLFATPAFAQAPWRDSLTAAERGYRNGEFAEALDHFDETRASLGERYDEEGEERWGPTEKQAYDATRCPRALSQLALLQGRGESNVSEEARDLAMDQANFACSDEELAVAAFLIGDTLQAALRLSASGRTRFVAPFSDRRLPSGVDLRLNDGELPLASDLDEAQSFVMAHAQLRHGLMARCYPARGIAWQTRGAGYEEAYNEVMDDIPEIPPFTGEERDALATMRCDYPYKIAPEERGFGDGLDAVAYLLRRESDGRISVRGSFPDFPSLDCWTSVVQSEVSNYGHAQPGLYAFVRAQGYSTPDGPERIIVTTHLCDVNRRRCRSFPVQVQQGDYHYDDSDQPRLVRGDWRSDFAVHRGRVVLTNMQGAPAGLRRFRRGVPMNAFFSSPSVEYELPDLTRPVEASRECPVHVADPDGTTNVRAAPGTRANVERTLDNGTLLEVEERRGRWWRISAPVRGWIWGPNTDSRCPPG